LESRKNQRVLKTNTGQFLISIKRKHGWTWKPARNGSTKSFPEIKRRTGRLVFLLMDDALGHFDAFERDNIHVVFFPLNCTSWKQPCDMGIIATLKKRYKYLYLKDILDFYELDKQLKQRKKELGKRL